MASAAERPETMVDWSSTESRMGCSGGVGYIWEVWLQHKALPGNAVHLAD